jgi:hypothetical protein
VTDKQRLAVLREAEAELKQTGQGYIQWSKDKKGGHWPRALQLLNELEKDLKPTPIPALGPIRRGGPSLLTYQLTHNTDGVPKHPALDENWGAGSVSIAPEALVVNPGAAMHARGTSKIEYWIGHLTRSFSIGTRIAKGQEVGRSVAIVGDDDEHTHWGINVERLFGAGVQLKYGKTGNGPDYTFGSPTIGQQLAVLLA